MTLPFDASAFYDTVLKPSGIKAVFGVPDSSLSGLLSYFAARLQAPQHIVTANEGGAVALASGYYLATQQVALCYMQNSGLSNALSPLQSLASPAVAGIPMLLMIGWRGKPGIKDEPQHALIGPRLLDNLDANGIPYEHIPENMEDAVQAVARLVAKALADKTPVALVVPPATFQPFKDTTAPTGGLDGMSLSSSLTLAGPNTRNTRSWLMRYPDQGLQLKRESVVRRVLQQVGERDVLVSSLGGTSREVYMVLGEDKKPISRIFFVLGAMGHAFGVASGIRLGLSQQQQQQQQQSSLSSDVVYCLDGDGSFLMHAGNNAVLADVGPRGLVHVVVHNGVHSSTGDQPLSLRLEAYLALAKGLSYAHIFVVDTLQALDRGLKLASAAAAGRPDADAATTNGPCRPRESALVVVLVGPGQSSQLPRPSETASHLKDLFMQSL